VSEPPGDEQWDDAPEEIVIDSFAEVTEITAEFSTTGGKVNLKGAGTPAHFVHLVFPPAVSLFGLVAGVALLLADRSIWLALAVAAISQAVALAWRKIMGRQADP
jgi:hypothetical protein